MTGALVRSRLSDFEVEGFRAATQYDAAMTQRIGSFTPVEYVHDYGELETSV